MKNKIVTAILAFPFGMLGTHRFYLGQRFLGALYLAFFIITVMITADEHAPVFLLSFLLPFLDAILFYAMPKAEFDRKYNKLAGRSTRNTTRAYSRSSYDFDRPKQANGFHELKSEGIDKFRNYDYEGAIEDFLDALEIRPSNPALHFNLACCYSILEDDDRAYYHLEEAIKCGFNDKDKIHTHDALAFLRSSSQFDEFVNNGYRFDRKRYEEESKAPAPSPELELPNHSKEQMSTEEADELLQQIVKLGELREKGILTEKEYLAQKKRILGS